MCAYVVVWIVFVGGWCSVSFHWARLFLGVEVVLVGVVELALEGSFFMGAGLDIAIGRYGLLFLRRLAVGDSRFGGEGSSSCASVTERRCDGSDTAEGKVKLGDG